jgi:surfeit locus 1 family protein
MSVSFRPFPGVTAACAVLLAFLIGLGVWQLQRLQWKLALIAEVTRNMAASPISLNAALALGHGAEYRHVALTGRFDNAKESYAYGIDRDAVPDYHVIVPFTTDDHRTLMVDRGIVPPARRDPATRSEGQIEGETRVTGVWRTPDAPGTFTPARDPAHRIWYTRDASLIAASDNITLASPALIEADATPNRGGLPKGGQTQVEFRNEHLQYAITWFLMAAGLFGVYLAYHVSKGRLVLTWKD